MADMGWFSDMDWQQVLLALLPVVLIVWAVKRIEKHQDLAPYKNLAPAAKVWLWLHNLNPSASAKAMLQCDPRLLRVYMAAGCALQNSSPLWLRAAAEEFLKESGIGVKFNSDDDLSAVLSEYVQDNAEEALAAVQSLWPVNDGSADGTEGELTASLEAVRQPDSGPILEPCAEELQPIAVFDDIQEAVYDPEAAAGNEGSKE